MSMVEPVEILRYARDVVLESEDKWTKGAFCRDERGDHTTLAHIDLATSYCATGAVGRAGSDLKAPASAVLDALKALYACAPSPLTTVGFNDHPATSFSDVIDLFDASVKKLEDA